MSYAKLFSSIIHSTIWREPAPTKVVWITMLAMANRRGVVEASVPGLADASKVTLEECQIALAKLSAPDEWSRTKEYSGRRIEEIDGGWLILNYEKHRTTADQEDVREQARVRARRFRASRSTVTEVRDSNAPSRNLTLAASPAPTPTPAPRVITNEPAVDSSASALAKKDAVKSQAISWTREACTIWDQRFKGKGPYGQIASSLSPIVERHGWAVVRAAWCRYLALAEAQYASPNRFSQTFGKWAGLAPDPPEKHDIAAHNIRAAQEAMDNPPDLSGLGTAVRSMPRFKP